MKISFLISSLGCGGAERVVSMLANHWSHKGWQIEVITLASADEPPFYPLTSAVRYTALSLRGSSKNKLHALKSNLRRLRIIRRAVQRSTPDVLISFMAGTNIHAVISVMGTAIPVVISERGVPGLQESNRAWDILTHLFYPYANALVVPSSGMANEFTATKKIASSVIPNPVLAPKCRRNSSAPWKKRLMAMGRLSNEKGYDLLLKAFQRVHERHPDASLTIVGEGPCRPMLESLRGTLGLDNAVQLPGVSNAPAEVMANADVFVLSSLHESFSNVLCEAMAVGLPVVSFNCPTGPADIIRDGHDGILVEPQQVEKLSETLIDLLDHPEECARLARNARSIVDRLSIEAVSARWEKLLQAVMPREGIKTPQSIWGRAQTSLSTERQSY